MSGNESKKHFDVKTLICQLNVDVDVKLNIDESNLSAAELMQSFDAIFGQQKSAKELDCV